MSVYNVRSRNRKAARRAVYCRAWLNGVEITSQCFYADPRRGVVRVWLQDEHGRLYRRDGELAKEERRGHVVVRRTR